MSFAATTTGTVAIRLVARGDSSLRSGSSSAVDAIAAATLYRTTGACAVALRRLTIGVPTA